MTEEKIGTSKKKTLLKKSKRNDPGVVFLI